jgi:hypothetical protein
MDHQRQQSRWQIDSDLSEIRLEWYPRVPPAAAKFACNNRFLALNLMYPDQAIVPCGAVDAFWHAHILDTAAYRDDCDRLFGQFFDHFPYFGLRDAQDAADLTTAYDETLALYRRHFGDLPPGVWQHDDAMKCQRKGCKPMKCRGM